MERLPILRQPAFEPEAKSFIVLAGCFGFDFVALAECSDAPRDLDFACRRLADLLNERLQTGEPFLHEFFRHLNIGHALMLQRRFVTFSRRLSSPVHVVSFKVPLPVTFGHSIGIRSI
jgi:hypothetical protein